jgi:hypothetical protein
MTISDALNQYSSFHDAELLSLSLQREDRELSMVFSAHRYETDSWRRLQVRLLGVTRLSISNAAASDPAFSEYVFPLTGLVARVSLPDANHIVASGDYAWAIDCEFQGSRCDDITG